MPTNEVILSRHKRELMWEEWMELLSHHGENRCRFPSERLLAYAGQIIAWEPDGSAIRETGSDRGEVWDKITAQGDDPQIYNYEYIEDFSGSTRVGAGKDELPLDEPCSKRTLPEGGITVNDSVQSISAQPSTESAPTDKNVAPAVRQKRELTWEERMELMSHFGENRARFPAEQLLPYMGKIIAWEPDGSAIRETGDDLRKVFDKIKAQGDDTSLYAYEDIPIL